MRNSLATLILLAALPLGAAESQWKMQFFHDKDNSSLEFRDFACTTPQTCVAVGVLSDSLKDKLKGAQVTTADGGAHWTLTEVKELPYSLFFLNPSQGWMLTDKGVWSTADGARTWVKSKSLKGLERVSFVTAQHGFAVGELKSLYETTDGGKEWTKRELSNAASLDPAATVYGEIAFHGGHGVVAGSYNPMQRQQEINWMQGDPSHRVNGPAALVLLETEDAGKTWKETPIKGNGRFSRIRFARDGTAFGLAEYPGVNKVPADIYRLDLVKRLATSILREQSKTVKDFAILPNGEFVVAAIELMGQANDVPIPGKLKMSSSPNQSGWVEEKTDYRAAARRPLIAAGDANNVWVATDTGMILKRLPLTH